MLVIITGRGADTAFKNTICKKLNEKIKYSQISYDEIIIEPKPCDFTVVFEKNLSKIKASYAAVILNHATSFDDFFCNCCIVNSANPKDAEIAKKCNGQVITCGMSLRDTVTFSSFTDEGCVLSIQRPITRFDGKTVEPFELPLTANCLEDRFAIMCSALILILGGYI